MTQSKLDEEIQATNNLEDTTIHNAKVLLTLIKYPAAYLTEVAESCVITEYQARLCLSHLINEGLIETVIVDPNYPDPRLLARVFDQSMKGQGGTINFQRKRWFALTSAGFKAVKNINWRTENVQP